MCMGGVCVCVHAAYPHFAHKGKRVVDALKPDLELNSHVGNGDGTLRAANALNHCLCSLSMLLLNKPSCT